MLDPQLQNLADEVPGEPCGDCEDPGDEGADHEALELSDAQARLQSPIRLAYLMSIS
jgi:hypothetical protein